MKDPKIKMEVSFETGNAGNKIHVFKYFISTYHLNGTYMGIRKLKDELFLCPHSVNDVAQFNSFGTSFKSSCEVSSVEMLQLDNTHYYELFLEDVDKSLIPIPVLNKYLLSGKMNYMI